RQGAAGEQAGDLVRCHADHSVQDAGAHDGEPRLVEADAKVADAAAGNAEIQGDRLRVVGQPIRRIDVELDGVAVTVPAETGTEEPQAAPAAAQLVRTKRLSGESEAVRRVPV